MARNMMLSPVNPTFRASKTGSADLCIRSFSRFQARCRPRFESKSRPKRQSRDQIFCAKKRKISTVREISPPRGRNRAEARTGPLWGPVFPRFGAGRLRRPAAPPRGRGPWPQRARASAAFGRAPRPTFRSGGYYSRASQQPKSRISGGVCTTQNPYESTSGAFSRKIALLAILKIPGLYQPLLASSAKPVISVLPDEEDDSPRVIPGDRRQKCRDFG